MRSGQLPGNAVVLTKSLGPDKLPWIVERPLRGWVSALRLVPSYLLLHDRLTEGFEISLVTFPDGRQSAKNPADPVNKIGRFPST